MEKTNENKEMTAQESLSLINEVLNKSRKSILRSNGKHFILWGVLLTVLSLGIYELWHITGNPIWNLLWFAMPIIGIPLVKLISRKDDAIPQNVISKQIGKVWLAYCVFVTSIFVISIFTGLIELSLVIVLLLGFAECISGIMLKNWPIIISGFILGVGGAFAAALMPTAAEQLLLFTIGGVILVVTGLIIKIQYR